MDFHTLVCVCVGGVRIVTNPHTFPRTRFHLVSAVFAGAVLNTDQESKNYLECKSSFLQSCDLKIESFDKCVFFMWIPCQTLQYHREYLVIVVQGGTEYFGREASQTNQQPPVLLVYTVISRYPTKGYLNIHCPSSP